MYFWTHQQNCLQMMHTSNEKKGNIISGNWYHCEVTEKKTVSCHNYANSHYPARLFYVFFCIPYVMISVQQKSFCVLQFSKTESVISVQRASQRRLGVAAPRNRLLVQKEEPRATQGFRKGGLKSSTDFFAKPTKVHSSCQPRAWHLSTNFIACVMTSFSHATIQITYGTSSSCCQLNETCGI